MVGLETRTEEKENSKPSKGLCTAVYMKTPVHLPASTSKDDADQGHSARTYRHLYVCTDERIEEEEEERAEGKEFRSC